MLAPPWRTHALTPFDYITPDDGTPWIECDSEHPSDSDDCSSDVDLITVVSEFEDQHGIELLNEQLRGQAPSLVGPPDSISISEPWAANLKYLTVATIADMALRAVRVVDRFVPTRDNLLTALLGLRSRLLRIEAKARFAESHDVGSVSCQTPDEGKIEDATRVAFENDELMEMRKEDVAASLTRTPPPWKRARTR